MCLRTACVRERRTFLWTLSFVAPTLYHESLCSVRAKSILNIPKKPFVATQTFRPRVCINTTVHACFLVLHCGLCVAGANWPASAQWFHRGLDHGFSFSPSGEERIHSGGNRVSPPSGGGWFLSPYQISMKLQMIGSLNMDFLMCVHEGNGWGALCVLPLMKTRLNRNHGG